jgi:hypothetical protein
VTPSFLEHLRHFAKQLPQPKIAVLLASPPAAQDEEAPLPAARLAQTS